MFWAVFMCFSRFRGFAGGVGGSPKGLVHNLFMQLFTVGSSKSKFPKPIFLIWLPHK